MKNTGTLLCVCLMCTGDGSSKVINLARLQIVRPDGYMALPMNHSLFNVDILTPRPYATHQSTMTPSSLLGNQCVARSMHEGRRT